MSIDIRMHGEAADDELRSLYEWLLNEPEIRNNVDPKLVAREPESGQMGTTLDVIALVTTSAVALPATIDVIRGWHATRRRKPEITFERGDVKLTLKDADSETIAKVLELASDA